MGFARHFINFVLTKHIPDLYYNVKANRMIIPSACQVLKNRKDTPQIPTSRTEDSKFNFFKLFGEVPKMSYLCALIQIMNKT